MRYYLQIVVAVAVVALFGAAGCFKAHAHGVGYRWNGGGGFSMDHQWRSPFGFSEGVSSGAILIDTGIPATPEQVEKALRDQRICAPVVMYTDNGRVTHPADGCTR